jgi:hypothetical protein
MQTLKFAMYLDPTGNVHTSSCQSAALARRIAGMYEMLPGGMIVLSTDVNATVGKNFMGKAKGFLKTWYNRVMKNKKVDDELRDMVKGRGIDTGWSVGNLFRGRFMSPKTNKVFNEKSFAVDIRGVPFEFVQQAAETLRKTFEQEGVLVIDYSNNKTYYMD